MDSCFCLDHAANAATLHDYMTTNHQQAAVLTQMMNAIADNNMGPQGHEAKQFYSAAMHDDEIFESSVLREPGSVFTSQLQSVLLNHADRSKLGEFFDQWSETATWVGDHLPQEHRFAVVYSTDPDNVLAGYVANASNIDALSQLMADIVEIDAWAYAKDLLDVAGGGDMDAQAVDLYAYLAIKDTTDLAEHHIYGSSRLGVQKYMPATYRQTSALDSNVVTLKGLSTPTPWYSKHYSDIIKPDQKDPFGNQYTGANDTLKLWHMLGYRHYEMTDHLGNVLATVLDRKTGHNPGGGATVYDYWLPDLSSVQDYYAFGMRMPQRHKEINDTTYRFGFNGQEKVNEIAGIGNHNSAEFWEYDTRLGRRWNIDPIVKTWESGYSAFANNSIWFSDPDGADTINVTKSKEGKWDIGSTKVAKGDDVFNVTNGVETKSYTFSEGQYGKRINVLNLENNDNYTLGIYHVSGRDEEGATGFAVTPGGSPSINVGSGKRLPDDSYDLAPPSSLGLKWVQPGINSGAGSGYVGGRGVRIHSSPSKAETTRASQWTEGCYVVCTDYSLRGGEVYFKSTLSIKTSRQINSMLGATKHYNAVGSKSRPGSEFKNGINYKLIQKTGYKK